jgi:hypothetical protein
VFSLLGQAGQQGPIQRLTGGLAAEADRVHLGDSVIAAAHGMMLQCRALHDQESVPPAGLPVAGRERQHGRDTASGNSAAEAIQAGVTPQAGDCDALWAITWRARSAARMAGTARCWKAP